MAIVGGLQLPKHGRSINHVTLVTVDNNGVDIANFLLSGVLDKTGKIPLQGDEVCFELVNCADTN